MARALRVQIDGDSSGGRKALDDVADEADKAAAATMALAREFKAAARDGGHLQGELNDVGGTAKQVQAPVVALARQTDNLAAEFREAARAAEKLDGQLASTRLELVRLNKEYARTGDAAVLKQVEQQYTELDKVARLKKRMQRDEEDAAKKAAAAAKDFAKEAAAAAKARKKQDDEAHRSFLARRSTLSKFLGIGSDAAHLAASGGSVLGAGASALGSASSAAGPYGTAAALAAGAVVGVPAATFIGGAAGGALGLGAAGAGVGLGLAGAWMGDPAKYGAMWDKTINGLQKRWIDSSRQFGGPLEDSLKVVDRVIRDLPVERIADISKDFTGPLVQGLGGFVTNAADGFADLLASAQPIVDVVGPELANLGGDIGDSLRAVGLGAEGGAVALGDAINALGYAVKAGGVLIMGFENTYKSARDFEKRNFEFIETVPVVGSAVDGLKTKLFDLAGTTKFTGKALHDTGKESEVTSDSFAGLAVEAAKASAEAGTLTDSLTAMRSAGLTSANANIALTAGWSELKKELAEGAKVLDINTEAGRQNQLAIIDQIEKAEAARQAQIRLTGDVAAADAVYAQNIEQIKKMAYAAGFNKDQVDALIRSLGGIPENTSGAVKINGLPAAIEGTGALARLLRSVEGNYFANIKVTSTGPLSNLLGMSRRATGGTQTSASPMLVGEKGPEIVWGDRGQFVSTAQQTRQLIAQAQKAATGPAVAGQSAAGATLRVVGAGPFAQLLQLMVDRGEIQLFAGGDPVGTRP